MITVLAIAACAASVGATWKMWRHRTLKRQDQLTKSKPAVDEMLRETFGVAVGDAWVRVGHKQDYWFARAMVFLEGSDGVGGSAFLLLTWCPSGDVLAFDATTPHEVLCLRPANIERSTSFSQTLEHNRRVLPRTWRKTGRTESFEASEAPPQSQASLPVVESTSTFEVHLYGLQSDLRAVALSRGTERWLYLGESINRSDLDRFG